MQNKFPNAEVPNFEEIHGSSLKDSHPHPSSTTLNLKSSTSSPTLPSATANTSPNKNFEIPSYGEWFCLSSIHSIEVSGLPSIFNNRSIDHKIYIEWRNTMFTMYHENPKTLLSISNVRKKVNCDIVTLIKIYNFLEKWGLINFGVNNGKKNLFSKGNVNIFKNEMDVPFKKKTNKKNLEINDIQCLSCNVYFKNDGSDNVQFFMNVCESTFLCDLCYKSGFYDSKFTSNDYIPLIDNHLKNIWEKSEELNLLNLVEKDMEWAEIGRVLGKSQTQCIMKYLKMNGSYLGKDKSEGLLINSLSNPIMSVIAFLCGCVSPKIAAEASRFCIKRICEENTDNNNILNNSDYLPMITLTFAGEKAVEQKNTEMKKIEELLKVLVELQIRKIDLKIQDFEDICNNLENERKAYQTAREGYKKEYEELKNRNKEKDGCS